MLFYILKEKKFIESDLDEFDRDDIRIGYFTFDELKKNRERLGVHEGILDACTADTTHHRSVIDVYDEYSFGIINIVDPLDVQKPKDRMAFLIKKNQFYLIEIIDEDESGKKMFLNTLSHFPQNASLGKIVAGVFEQFLANGNRSYERTERIILSMEQQLVDGQISQDLNKDIFKLRRNLSVLKNYYEQLYDIGIEFLENENDIFSDADLPYFRMFSDKAARLSDNIQQAGEDLIHLRDALSASLDYNLNKIMKIFTVVTTIFMPLTLIVGWYGMNFEYMPELKWHYGYAGVAIFCAVLACLGILWFKKKKFM